MERVKKERKSNRTTIISIIREVDQEMNKEVFSKTILRTKLKRLIQLQQEVLRLDREILDILLDNDADEDALEEERSEAEAYLEKVFICRDIIETCLERCETVPRSQDDQASVYTAAKPKSQDDSASVISAATKRKFKLPKIELKKFNGELKEWLGWWAQFKKIHEDESLDPTDKFQYLYQSTVAGSKAREVVDAYPQSSENYPKVIDKLTERFGKKKLLKQVYVRELLKLVSAGAKGTDGISSLYYALDSHTRALASLGVTTEQAAEFLYPMVESCLPEELLIVWQRHSNYLKDGSTEDPPMTELSYLLEFLRVEVENQEQRKLTKSEACSSQKYQKQKKTDKNLGQDDVSTSAGLYESKDKDKCVFCTKVNHQSQECLKALNMSLEDKKQKVKEANGCWVCLKTRPRCKGSKSCKALIRCSLCSKKHYHFMCPDLETYKRAYVKATENSSVNENQETTQTSTETVAVNNGAQCGSDVLLKTVLVRVLGKGGVTVLARLLFDEGSQSSYVTSHIVNKVQSKPFGEERVRTIMIDGKLSAGTLFYKHKIAFQNTTGGQIVKLPVKERQVIGGILPRPNLEKWCHELKNKGITIVDHSGSGHDRSEIDVLIGGDFRESLMTGNRVKLSNFVYAVESFFGWMICGPVDRAEVSASEFVTQSYFTGDITQLWNLDVLGIKDTADRLVSEEHDRRVKEDFQKSVTRELDGRYVVKLPWVNDEVKSHLPTNEAICVKRLDSATAKIDRQGKFSTYDDVFKGWEEEGIVEVPAVIEPHSGHYLPHRPVFKDSLTTPVRPVFDASCHASKSPSLNQCLEKGPNWLELIPAMLVRFREKKIGVISDIRKAFQMISVAEDDRKFQKFLWWNSEGGKKELKPYQHCRVVFGLKCSPFILAAILDLHLSQVKEEWKDTADILKRSLYVDNCVTSFEQESDYLKFKTEAIQILAEAKMDLRQWESQVDQTPTDNSVTTVLGLKWDKVNDTLYCQLPKEPESKVITKRAVLSLVSQIFEPIGYASPALLQPKLMLQESWAAELGWDDEWDEERRHEFDQWYSEVKSLEQVQIPRNAFGTGSRPTDIQLHVFTDGSQVAYAGVVFVRVVRSEGVSVQLLASKARVAPLDKKKKNRVTIPRLELLGCLVGARLYNALTSALEIKNLKTHFWSDSTTALSWIRREEDWGTFVGNRVREIVKLCDGSKWRHVPGVLNPADLPSRGCSPKALLESKWWEGPSWLYEDESEWPNSEEVVDEELVNSERRKTTLVATQSQAVEPRFSSYLKNLRVSAWVRRFIHNSKAIEDNRVRAPYFKNKEMWQAEMDLIRTFQKRYFGERPKLKNRDVFEGHDGLLRVKSRLIYKTDTDQFKTPILLPREEPLVHQLVHHIHRTNSHGGVQFVLGKLREKYWITRGRKTVGAIIQKCVVCKRHKGKHMQPDPAPLPKDRVETLLAFQTTGVDLAGPLILKGGEKAWIVLYTCAVYRGIHLDLISSLSTVAFLNSLERFVSLVGRGSRIYSDHGTNFIGSKNLMKILDWGQIEEQFQVKEIAWTFNPPAAPWWGGFWERMVRSTKELLRRMLGTAKLTFDELRTCLASVAGTINDRPLTTLTEDGEDLIPLTPRMFIRDLPVGLFPEGAEIGSLPLLQIRDGAEVGAKQLRIAYKKMQVVKEALRARFRKEYLALLVQKTGEKSTPEPRVGDVVLIGMDDKKRFQWPLGKIEELGVGADGKVRVAKVRIALRPGNPYDFTTSVLTRPLQRLYPLEMSTEEERMKVIEAEVSEILTYPEAAVNKIEPVDDEEVPPARTRSGRKVKKPQRYGTWNS